MTNPLYPYGPEKAMGNEPDVEFNMREATNKMNLSPQEQAFYKRHLRNLYSEGGVDNPDGSRSTLYQASVEIEGKTYNIPTVWDGKILSVDKAVEKAEEEGLDKFPSYSSAEEANKRYEEMHKFMDLDMQQYRKSKP